MCCLSVEARRRATRARVVSHAACHPCGRPVPVLPPGQTEPELLPDHVVQSMLKRELLLTRAKLHALTYEHIMGERKMRTYKSQLKQARPGPLVRTGLMLLCAVIELLEKLQVA